jgi:hypothetical protein
MMLVLRLIAGVFCTIWAGLSLAGDPVGEDLLARKLGEEVDYSRIVALREDRAPIPHHREPYLLDTGAQENLRTIDVVAFRQVVQIPGAPWLQLHFGAYNLGEKSYLTITSLKDGDQQRFDAEGLARWSGASAFFNGDSLEVKLHVTPGESGVFFRLTEITVGESIEVYGTAPTEAPPVPPELICGNDDRVSSRDAAVGRTFPRNCTAWIGSNGAFLSAGHCTPFGANGRVEFNVPASDANGDVNHPPAADQYPIDLPSVNANDGTFGDDWAVFRTLANANGDFAIHRQASFYRMSRDMNPTTFRVTGYGADGPAPCFGDSRQPGCNDPNPPRNSDSQTQQAHAAASHGETVAGPSDVWWAHEVDVTGGNSGSPLLVHGTTFSLGISTAATPVVCAGVDWNVGTSFENDNLEDAVENFPGANVVYVDKGHTIVIEDGTVFRPYDTILEAANAAPSGANISIVTGSYNESMTLNSPMTLTAPVGVVTIGQ